jgi:outer membrane lipoprotein-sorting protein
MSALVLSALFALPAMAQETLVYESKKPSAPAPKSATKPAARAAPAAGTPNPQDQKLLRDLETYVNSLQSIKGDFSQASSNGITDGGVFYINKPGRMRLEYKSPMLLIADGTSMVYHDKKLDQISYIALDSNPASVILNGNITLAGPNPSVRISDISASGDETLVTVANPNERQSGRLTLVFQTRPLSLVGWTVRDPQGITTSVTLSNITPEKNPDGSLFKITRGKSFTGAKSKSKYY